MYPRYRIELVLVPIAITEEHFNYLNLVHINIHPSLRSAYVDTRNASPSATYYLLLSHTLAKLYNHLSLVVLLSIMVRPKQHNMNMITVTCDLWIVCGVWCGGGGELVEVEVQLTNSI